MTQSLDDFDLTFLAIVATLVVVWLLASQRGTVKKLMAKHIILRAVIEGSLFLALTYALDTLLKLLLRVPLFSNMEEVFPIIAEVLVYLGYAGFFARIAEGILVKLRSAKQEWQMSNLSRTAFYSVFVIIAICVFLVNNNITPSQVYVWTGATAAVFAFIMQQTLADLFSGLAVSLEKPFIIGDWLRLSDGTEGQVRDINWRATHLQGWDKTIYVIPNATLARESFTNLRGRRHVFAPWYTVQVSGEHDPAKVIDLLKKAAASCTYTLPSPAPVVRLMQAESSPYTYMIWVHFQNYPTMFAGREEVYSATDAVLRAEGITIAAEMQEIKLSQAGAPLKADATAQ